jgi:ferredoxin
MKAIVDQDTCIACGLCIDLCPDVFHEGPEGKAIAVDGPISEENEDTARDAADQCPVEAIAIEE